MKLLTRLDASFNPRGRTSRRVYASWGFGLLALKLGLDRIVIHHLGGDYWRWLMSYWEPIPHGQTAAQVADYAFVILALALPFITAGVMLTLRRLRDAGWPLWLVVIFFVPAVNFVLFTLLCLAPARDQPREQPPADRGWVTQLARNLALKSRALSAVIAIILTIVAVTLLTGLATVFFKNYGWSVFVALPFVLGMIAAVVHSAPEPRTWWQCTAVALLALFFSALAILAVAIEGAICLLMAAPLAIPIVMLGATAGYFLQVSHWSRALHAGRVYGAAWLAIPLALVHEMSAPRELPLVAATTCVDIAASPATVWRHVVTFSELPPPTELVFRSGIAYPVRATITGHGVGAVRHCEFSTGPFVEPITIWDENRRLAFDVVAQPHPMRELSPYRSLHPPHLDGFFHSRRGEFLLTPLANGHTRLEGTTWYTQNLWPGHYWQRWSDYLVHNIHRRVLDHIRTEAERRSGESSVKTTSRL